MITASDARTAVEYLSFSEERKDPWHRGRVHLAEEYILDVFDPVLERMVTQALVPCSSRQDVSVALR